MMLPYTLKVCAVYIILNKMYVNYHEIINIICAISIQPCLLITFSYYYKKYLIQECSFFIM